MLPGRRRIVLLVLPFLLVMWMLGRQSASLNSDIVEGAAPATSDVRDGVSQGTTRVPGAVTSDAAALAEYALSSCRADEHNTPGHKSCILLKNAIVTHDMIYYEEEIRLDGDRSAVGDVFPAPPSSKHMRSRFQLKPYVLKKVAPGDRPVQTSRRTTFAMLQGPVSGAQWLNVWHTIADFFSTLYDTAQPFFEMGGKAVDLEWITRPALHHVGKGCATGVDCRRLSLFDPFERLFGGRVTFMEPSMEPLAAQYLLIGINTRCCPIPMTGVGTEYCHRNLKATRDKILSFYGLPVDRHMTQADLLCPHVHFMSRQGDVYRHMTPFAEVVGDLEGSFRQRGEARGTACSSADHLRVIKLSGSLPFAEQVRSVANSSVLMAGRGGGTTLSMFLPLGGLYVSISGFDRWSPFRDLVPQWIHLAHVEVKLVHHLDSAKPPQMFKAGGKSYVDPNRAAYLISPANQLSVALWSEISKLQG